MHKLSYARGLVGSCREAFSECWASKVNKTTLFCTKIQFWDVKVKFFLFRLLLMLRMDFYCHQKYARYLHTLGVKTRSLADIFLIFFSVRGALKIPFLTPWDIFSSVFWSIFLLFCCFPTWKIFLNPTYSLRDGRMCSQKWQEPLKKILNEKKWMKSVQKVSVIQSYFLLAPYLIEL